MLTFLGKIILAIEILNSEIQKTDRKREEKVLDYEYAAGCQMQVLGKVPWRCRMKALESQNTEPKLYPLWNSQPMEFAEQESDVFYVLCSMGRVGLCETTGFARYNVCLLYTSDAADE